MDYPKFIVSNQKEESISIQKVNRKNNVFVKITEFIEVFVLTTFMFVTHVNRRFVKSAYQKTIYLISQPKTYVVGTQKNRLDETVLLRTQNIC